MAAVVLFAASAGMLAGCGSSAPVNRGPAQRPVIDGVEGYHVIVAGGEPEGIAAALSAARNGMSTLLVEKGDALGGLMTLGMLNFLDMNYGPGNPLPETGIVEDFYNLTISRTNGILTPGIKDYLEMNDGKNNVLLTRGIFAEFFIAQRNSFDIENAKKWFMDTCLAEPNLTVMLNTEIIAPVLSGNTITGLEIKRQGVAASEIVRSKTVIDATVDADIAAAAGVPFTVGGEDYGAHGVFQGVTLIFKMNGVDWRAVIRHINRDGNPNSGVGLWAAWGYATEAQGYVPTDENMRFRGPNIARQRNGDVFINALIIFGVDALDPVSYAEGIKRGENELPYLVEYIRENFAGFEDASYIGHAPRLYVRETRHIVGEYRLTITDVLENRDHWDRIGHGNYPVDIQPTDPRSSGNAVGAPDIYSIPFRCLVPLEIDQLLVTGRSASYNSLPHGSTRVLPIGMVTGEACGAAAAYSITHGVTFRQMAYDTQAILWLQNRLRKQNAYIVEYVPPRMEVMDHWAYPGLVVLRELGLNHGGYSNNYGLDVPLPHRWALQTRINTIMRIVNERSADDAGRQIVTKEYSFNSDKIPVSLLLLTAAECASMYDMSAQAANLASGRAASPLVFADAADAADYLMELNILEPGALQYFPDYDVIATMGQLVYILGNLYTALVNEK